MDNLTPKFQELTEVRKTTVATSGWRENVASSMGVSICEFAERLASELRE